MPEMPIHLWEPTSLFQNDYAGYAEAGRSRIEHSKIAFVGLARNCDIALAENLMRIESLSKMCKDWRLHIESNDCEDKTVEVLAAFSREHKNASFHYRDLGRKQYPSEFSGRRTIALAEYRTMCQRWVRSSAADADYVVVIDFDAMGGWNETGFLNGLGWMVELQGAYGMASLSLFQHAPVGQSPQWLHYDLWALRGIGQRNCYFDSYRNNCGGFGFTWIPPVGSPPVLVSSAFGGLCIYRTGPYLLGEYDGTSDVEHATFHESIARKTGMNLYLNPSQRMIMSWIE